MAKGYESNFVIRDGGLWASGRNNYGQLGDGSKTAKSAFVKVADDTDSYRQTWRIKDTGLLKVYPMGAMSKSRRARTALGPGSTVDVDVELTGGSAQIVLDFDSVEQMKAFDARLSRDEVPETLGYGAYNVELGALEFIDRRTGTSLQPEVRFFVKHDTPTTETAIASTLYEDLYLAMRPGQGFINMLVVVFPLVSFLWAGAILLVLGTLVLGTCGLGGCSCTDERGCGP